MQQESQQEDELSIAVDSVGNCPNTKQVECGLFLFKKGKNRVGRLLELEKNTKNKEKQSFSCST